MEQLQATINLAEHCEQELTYYCKKSRLVNKQGKETEASVLPRALHRELDFNSSCGLMMPRRWHLATESVCPCPLSKRVTVWKPQQCFGLKKRTRSIYAELCSKSWLPSESLRGLHHVMLHSGEWMNEKGFIWILDGCSVFVPYKGQVTYMVCSVMQKN